MNEFEIINSKIKELKNEIEEYAKSLEFEPKCEFTLENCDDSIPWNEIKGKGVYFIEIKNNKNFNDFETWVENFKLEWEDPSYKRKFVPNLKKKRIKKQDGKFDDWIPLYIGKSNNINRRVWEHIHKELDKHTFALKLKARKHAEKETFRLSVIQIPTENYNIIMPIIENALRGELNPIIGRQ